MKPEKSNIIKKRVEYHPLLRKVIPAPIIKIAEDNSVGQYLLMFMLFGVAMIIIPVAAVLILTLLHQK